MISGRQLSRTGTMDDPSPTDVYPTISWYFQAPEPIRRGRTESSVTGMAPGRQIWPPWVCPLSSRLFYDDLFDHVKSLNPLDVERIQYASPGQIALRGDGEAFSDIDRIIETFDVNHKQLRSMYNSLHGILRKERLLRARAGARFANSEQTEHVRSLTVALADKMRLEKRDEIFEACNRNTLIFCKVILSIYRRANEIYTFHEEGRVQSE